MSEAKIVDVKFEGSKLSVTVDPNKNGQPVVEIKIDLGEALSEVTSVISKKAE